MNPFPDKLHFEDAGLRRGNRQFRLEKRFRYLSSFGCIEVPAGTITDGASVPRAFWNFLDPFSDYFCAAVVHDYLYSPANCEFDRWESDIIFKEAMYNAGVPWQKREIIYHAVRMFGGKHFQGKPPRMLQ